MKIARSLSTLLFGALVVAGCGGGGGGSSTSGTTVSDAQGLYIGTSNNRNVTGIILDNGTYYIFYTYDQSSNYIAGVVHGTGTASNGTFTSTNAKDFSLEYKEVLSATVSANYVPMQSANGTITYPSLNETNSFALTYDSYYDLTPSLEKVAGTYEGTASSTLGQNYATVTIASSGAISGQDPYGCTYGGTVTPRTSGNLYNFTVTFSGTSCYFANQSMTGILYLDENDHLIAAAPNADKTEGILFEADK